MKTTKLRLFATMITLAAITIATTIPANAQRRSTQQRSETKAPERNRNMKSIVQKKSTFRQQDKVRRNTVNPKLKSTRNSSNRTATTASKKSSTLNRSSASRASNGYRSSPSKAVARNSSGRSKTYATRSASSQNRSTSARASRNMGNRQSLSRTVGKSLGERPKASTDRSRVQSQNSGNSKRNYANSRTSISGSNKSTYRMPSNRQHASTRTNTTYNKNAPRRTTGTSGSNLRNFYRNDISDKRYSTTRNYKGSQKYWSDNYRSKKMNYRHNNSKYYRHYNYSKYRHWDNRWEHYRWNHNSWRDYYQGYHPNSYIYHKHYYQHHLYGHVIRYFDYRPQVFVHNHHNYYCYNGHFFRYRRGIGYILVDVPFGLSFEFLPHNYERVNINGYVYFRVGNLFFEWSNYGFKLVHYPERYYAYNDEYCNHGYRFNDDYYYNDDY